MRDTLLAIAVLPALLCAPVARAADRGPSLDVRPSPRFLRNGGEVLLTAQLAGGADVEAFHCPRVVWEFGDGSSSAHESDCEPWSEGTRIERFYQVRHLYVAPGEYQVHAALWRGEKKVKEAHAIVLVAGE